MLRLQVGRRIATGARSLTTPSAPIPAPPSSHHLVTSTIKEEIGVITLCDPSRLNALTQEMGEQFVTHVEQMKKVHPSSRVLSSDPVTSLGCQRASNPRLYRHWQRRRLQRWRRSRLARRSTQPQPSFKSPNHGPLLQLVPLHSSPRRPHHRRHQRPRHRCVLCCAVLLASPPPLLPPSQALGCA
jgi:hypothetical protein